MNKKKAAEQTVIRKETVQSEGAEYNYTLLMSESRKVSSYRIPLYSILVEMTDESGNRTDAGLKDVFADVGKALVFYDKLVSNLATPLNLPYILEDELS